jgi:hypothetical protein
MSNKDIKKCKNCYWYHSSCLRGNHKDWCCRIGKVCAICVGECKLKGFFRSKKGNK